MDSITPPAPMQLEELRGKAQEMYRTSREYSQPLPQIIPIVQSGVDPEAVDHIASQAFSSLYQSDKYSDLVIKCQDRVWRAHKAVVCSQSKVLAACVDGQFREAQTNEIDLSEDEPEIVEHMIEYLYKGFYDFEIPILAISSTPEPASTQPDWVSRIWKKDPIPTTTPHAAFLDITPHYATPLPSLFQVPSSSIQPQDPGRVPPTPSRLVTHASVYCIAEQYDIPRLKTYALCKYSVLAPLAWKSPFFIPSLRLIYERTPSRLPHIDDLRAVAAKTAAENSHYFLERVDFLECCTENAEVALDVMRMMMVLKKREYVVDWKTKKVWCKVDRSHELVYIPQLEGFGVGTFGGNGRSMGNIGGFGRADRGRYKCLRCGHTVV